MLTRLYNWTMDLAAQPYALWALALVAFAESSVFPIPPDVMLIPMVLVARARAWVIAGVCTIASVVGGIAGYGIGYFLYEAVGQPIIAFLCLRAPVRRVPGPLCEMGGVDRGGRRVHPHPLQDLHHRERSRPTRRHDVRARLAAVARWRATFSWPALLWYFGPPIRAFIEGNLRLLVTAFFVLLAGGFIVLSYLV